MHNVNITATNVHDITVTSDLLTGEGTYLYVDSGYIERDKKRNVIEEISMKIKYNIKSTDGHHR